MISKRSVQKHHPATYTFDDLETRNLITTDDSAKHRCSYAVREFYV
jgi:hypothetical protein